MDETRLMRAYLPTRFLEIDVERPIFFFPLLTQSRVLSSNVSAIDLSILFTVSLLQHPPPAEYGDNANWDPSGPCG